MLIGDILRVLSTNLSLESFEEFTKRINEDKRSFASIEKSKEDKFYILCISSFDKLGNYSTAHSRFRWTGRKPPTIPQAFYKVTRNI